MEIGVVSIILLASLILLVSDKLPIGLTAVGIMVTLMVTRLLPPVEAVQGLAHPAVVTVAAMLVLSRALVRTGAVGFIGQRVVLLSRGKPNLALLLVLLIVAAASAFINNTPVVVLFIPVVLSLSCEFELSPSKLLIPVSYASILAGTCTLIGTSTNIIVSDLSALKGYGPLGMFELSIIGIPIAVIGIAFLYFFSPKVLPELVSPVCELGDGRHRLYLAELSIPRGSTLIGQAPDQAFSDRYPNLKTIEVIRYSHIFHPRRDGILISADDLLLVKGPANDLIDLLGRRLVDLPPQESGLKFNAAEKEALIVELIIPPHSSLVGERLRNTRLKRDPDIQLVAIKRSGLHYTEQKIFDIRLKIGDIILVRCPDEKLARMRGRSDYIIAEDIHHEIVHKQKAGWALGIFAAMVGGAASGAADIMVCALAAVFLMVLTGCLSIRDAYRALQGDVLLLIAGTIALGAAMEKSGAARFYAEAFLSVFRGLPPSMILAALILLTSIGTQLLSNNATAVLILPLAISMALGLGVHPKPFIIGVCLGASACFATPIGYQTNLLVYGPGGYRFSDYLKLGIPLNLLVLILGAVFIPLIWPF